MSLVSCPNCNVVLDADFPQNIELEDGSIDIELADWDGEEYVPKIQCPVCQHTIVKRHI